MEQHAVEPEYGMQRVLRQLLAVVEKELRSEFRQRVSAAVTVLTIGVIVVIFALALRGVALSAELFSALLWVVFFLCVSPAVGRSFLAEEERGTRLLLYATTSPGALYWGKLVTNMLIGFLTMLLGCGLLALVLAVPLGGELWALGVLIGVAAVGFAACLTLLSAAIAGAHHRGMLLPVVSVPIVVPLLVPGIEATQLLLEGGRWAAIAPLLSLMLGYGGVIAVVGFWLFEWVWHE